ncbi:MAG: hypothetical protein Q8S17_06065, partial [Humidesulfovibrio sp.]|nr:hypothetical protein [Humidesulfovibrio sp.]
MPRSKKPVSAAAAARSCPLPPAPVRQELMAIMAAAPAPVRRALCDLLLSVKAGLAAAGQTPKFVDARAK